MELPNTFTKYIYDIEDTDGDLINLKLVLSKTSGLVPAFGTTRLLERKYNYKGDLLNCRAEIYDSEGRYFYAIHLSQPYEYYLELCEKDKLNVVFTTQTYFDGPSTEYDNIVNIDDTENIVPNLNVIYLNGGSDITDPIPLYEHKEKHLVLVKDQIFQIELELEKLKKKQCDLEKNYCDWTDK